jgi:hypothetical protein
MDGDILTFSSLIGSTLLGVIVGGLLQYYITKGQDERRFKIEEEKRKKFDFQRRVAAYRRLKGLIDIIVWRSGPTTVRALTPDELEKIELTIAQNYDVLDETTVAAWDTRNIVQPTASSVTMQIEAFIPDVKKHYDQYRYKAIPPTS